MLRLRSFLLCIACAGLAGHSMAEESAPPANATQDPAAPTPADAFRLSIAQAHGAETLEAGSVLSFMIQAEINGTELINGEMLSTPDLSQVRYEGVDGTVVICDGNQTYVHPDSVSFPRREDFIKLWPLLVTAPYQLGRNGYQVTLDAEHPLDGIAHATARLQFTPPHKTLAWALLYKNSESMLDAIAYQLSPTSGTQVPPAIVVFRKFEQIGNLRIPSVMEFFRWDAETGTQGERNGVVTVTQIQFLPPDPRRFELPIAEAIEQK